MSKDPLSVYDQLKTVPKEFTKTINAGRLKGMSDIKPQWRIMKLTELFGPCGIGWKVQNVEYIYKEISNSEVVVNCRLEFFFKVEEQWSDPIPASGGSKLATQERNGLYVSDEAEKMAFTDALSVAGKMIGLASDIYMGYGSKYSNQKENVPQVQRKAPKPVFAMESDAYSKAVDSFGKFDSWDKLEKALKSKYTVADDVLSALQTEYNVSKENF